MIKERPRSLSETQRSTQPIDHVQASEDAFRLLEDIQVAVLDYQVRSQLDTLLDVDEDSRLCNKRWPTIKNSEK